MAKSLLDLMNDMNDFDDKVSSRVEYIKSGFCWPGSKQKSLSNILDKLPIRNGFIEVFGGSGAVTLNRPVSKFQVFNDANSGVVAFFRTIRDPEKLERFIDFINLTPHAREEFCDFKRDWVDELDDVIKACKFYYCAQTSFHGEMRVFGRTRSGLSNTIKKLQNKIELLPVIADKFLSIQIENLDWRVCLKDFDNKDAVFYLDPPYVDKNCYKHKMSHEDHHEMCRRIMQMDGFVALSGYDNDIYGEYDWDHIYSWEVKENYTDQMFNTDRENKMKGQSRGVGHEHLWIKE